MSSIVLFLIFIYFMCGGVACLYVCLCTTHMPVVSRGQKGLLDLLRLEIQKLGAGDKTQVLWKGSGVLSRCPRIVQF